MKKLKNTKILALLLFSVMAISAVNPVFALNYIQDDTTVNSEYDREDAIAYANNYYYFPNGDYRDYSSDGGDCTNFVSQCLAAGGMTMRGSQTAISARLASSWFYYGPNVPNRSTSWTGAENFRKHWANDSDDEGNNRAWMYRLFQYGYAAEHWLTTTAGVVRGGDPIQLVYTDGEAYHTMFALQFLINPMTGDDDIYYAQHSDNKKAYLSDLFEILQQQYGNSVDTAISIGLIRVSQ